MSSSLRSTLLLLSQQRLLQRNAQYQSQALLRPLAIRPLISLNPLLQSVPNSAARSFSTTPEDDGKKKRIRKPLPTSSDKPTVEVESSSNGKRSLSGTSDDKSVAGIVRPPPPPPPPPAPQISPKTITFVVKDRPLIPEHFWNVSGTDEMLGAVLGTIASKEPSVCIFYMPQDSNIEAELPMNGTLARIESVWVSTNLGQYFISNKGEVHLNYNEQFQGQREASISLEELIKRIRTLRVEKWEAKLNALSIVQRTPDVSKVGDIPYVEYTTPVKQKLAIGEWEESKQKEFEAIWTSFLNSVQLTHLPAMRRGQEDWKLICCHLLSLFPSISGADIQRVFDETDPVEGVRFTVMMLDRERKVFEHTREMVEAIQIDQHKLIDRATKLEVIKRIQKDIGQGPGEDKLAAFKARLAKFNESQKQAATATSSVSESTTSNEQKDSWSDQKSDDDKADELFWKEQLAKGGRPLQMPGKVRKAVEEEMSKFESMERNSGEYHTIRNYIDWLTSIPWGRTTADIYDVQATEKILNEDHYGMEDVKKRILEFVAISKLKQSQVKGSKIICLVGPPGVGKTSIGQSIAKALGKKFYRFSVGGLFDVSEIKGHRRTYIGALPGKLAQMFKSVGAVNPLMMIDEIDKIGRGSTHGDPAAALLELLDPSQNGAFVDHYLDLPLDASNVLFICTANSLSTIRGPLLDRLEVIEIPGYDNVEKVEISKKYLEPKLRAETGLTKEDFPGLTDSALATLAQSYARESGVRNLSKLIEKIYRRVALEIVQTGKPVPTITENDLVKYVGQPKYRSDRMFGDITPPGVVMGLAYDGEGGRALYVESTSTRDYSKPKKHEGDTELVSTEKPQARGSISSTGNLGETMKESVALAYANAKRECDTDFFDYNEVKLHVPHGGIPKDGPSAGITLTCSLLSLAWHLPISPIVAMTGEITLTGVVLPVGGIKDKVLAAKRNGTKVIIMPDDNQRDWNELAEHIRNDVEVKFVRHIKEILPIVFPSKFPENPQ